jgi:predicted nucleotidyltransferase
VKRTKDIPPAAWEGQIEVEEEVFRSVVRDVVRTLEASEVPFVLLGGIASSAQGRPRWTHDVDIMVRPADALRTLEAFRRAGFVTQTTNHTWLYKALKDDVLVDVVFRSDGEVVLDEEMLARSLIAEFQGVRVPVLGAEDLIVIKALVHKEHAPRHWFDALALIARSDLDWSYLERRAAAHNPLRVASLLCYAQSADLPVPEAPIERLTSLGGLAA